MRRPWIAALLAGAPAPALAHDAFGDLGPFYGSLLHPLADPLQGALVVGTAAFLARRPLATVRVALPVFLATAALSQVLLAERLGLVAPSLLLAAAAIVVGGAATLADRWVPAWSGILLVAAIGALVSLAADRPTVGGAALQPVLGAILGIAIFVTLVWAMLDALARRVSPVAPAVAGSWVAAAGMLIGAFSLQPAPESVSDARLETALESPAPEGREP